MRVDKRLTLLSGLPFKVGSTDIDPLTLKDIVQFGYFAYLRCLHYFTTDVKDILGDIDISDEYKDLNVFDILMNSKGELYNNFVGAIHLFFKDDNIVFDKDTQSIISPNGMLINRDNWFEFVDIIKLQNCVKESDDDDDFNVKGDKAREIAAKIKKAREKINKIKTKKGEQLDLCDLISAYASYNNNINILDVWNLTMYQFENQFQRMQLISDYEVTIQSILHGADSQKVNIKHYISKL